MPRKIGALASRQTRHDAEAASLKNFHTDLMLPGIMVNTSADDYFPIEQLQLMRFNGQAWELFGDVITGEVGRERGQ